MERISKKSDRLREDAGALLLQSRGRICMSGNTANDCKSQNGVSPRLPSTGGLGRRNIRETFKVRENSISFQNYEGKEYESGDFLMEENSRRRHYERRILQLKQQLSEERKKLEIEVNMAGSKSQTIHKLRDDLDYTVHRWKELDFQSDYFRNRNRAENTNREDIRKQDTNLDYRLCHSTDTLLKNNHSNLSGKINSELKDKTDSRTLDAKKLNIVESLKEIRSLHNKIKSFKIDLFAIKEEKEIYNLELHEVNRNIMILENEKQILQTTLADNQRKEASIQYKIKHLTREIEIMTRDLLHSYSGLENEGITEEQVNMFKNVYPVRTEFEVQEHTSASKQCQLDIQLLEEKHKEVLQEPRDLTQVVQQFTNLKKKLECLGKLDTINDALYSASEPRKQNETAIHSSDVAEDGREVCNLQTMIGEEDDLLNDFEISNKGGIFPKQNDSDSDIAEDGTKSINYIYERNNSIDLHKLSNKIFTNGSLVAKEKPIYKLKGIKKSGQTSKVSSKMEVVQVEQNKTEEGMKQSILDVHSRLTELESNVRMLISLTGKQNVNKNCEVSVQSCTEEDEDNESEVKLPILQSHETETQILDGGMGLALCFFYGYLRLVLPVYGVEKPSHGLERRILDYMKNEKIKDSCFPVKKLFILIPHNANIPPNLQELSVDDQTDGVKYWMADANSLEPEIIVRDGVSKAYPHSVYKIRDPDKEGTYVYVVAEGATPLKVFHDMININPNHKRSAIVRKQLHRMVLSFYETLHDLLRRDDACKDLCELICYADVDTSGKKVNVARLILDRISAIQ